MAIHSIPLLKIIAAEIIAIAKAYDKELSMTVFADMIAISSTQIGYKPNMLCDYEQHKHFRIYLSYYGFRNYDTHLAIIFKRSD